MRSFILGIVVLGLVGWGCGGGGSSAGPANKDGALDAPVDAAVEAARAPGVTCPPIGAGEKRGLGACCAAAVDCTGGVCWNGFCTKTCGSTAECGPVVAPTPLPTGTVLGCAPNMLADAFSYCLPGSLRDCTTAGSALCPAGEDCALGLNPTAIPGSPAPASYVGLCLTRLVANEYLPAGSPCEPEAGPYACENQGGYLGSGCFSRRCTRACSASTDCPIGMQCAAPPYSPKLGGAVSFMPQSGPGICLGRFCGQVHGEVGGIFGKAAQQGADVLCVAGEACVPTIAVGATGDAQYLSCVPPRTGALPFGATCSKDSAQALRCADDSLCVERSGSRFCSALCRVDADCPAGAVCVDDYPTPPLPYGTAARLAMCTPRALIPGVACQTERNCAATEGCVPLSGRSIQMVCRTAVGTKSVGQTCASASECRSGECVDRDLHIPTGANRTTCAAACAKNSDCGTGQICQRVVRNNNGTLDDPRDDIIVGICTTLDAPALVGGCATNDNCTGQTSIDETGGDTCDPVHRTCYTQAARIGDPCEHRANCPLGAYCRLNDPRFPGGACLSLGCDPAATAGVDACPEGSVCAERDPDRPLMGCYTACLLGAPCARVAERYVCERASAASTAVPICIWQGGP